MMMKCYSLLVGARNAGGGGHGFSAADDRRIREITFRSFPNGFTILNADGGWFDPATGRFVREKSRQILVCTARPQTVWTWCRRLLRALGQQELLVVELGRGRTVRVRERPRRAR
jgi:hypothetical protein